MQKLTKEQAVILSAYTGVLMCDFSDFRAYAEKKMGRPIWTHEFADERLVEALRKACKKDFMSLMPEDSK